MYIKEKYIADFFVPKEKTMSKPVTINSIVIDGEKYDVVPSDIENDGSYAHLIRNCDRCDLHEKCLKAQNESYSMPLPVIRGVCMSVNMGGMLKRLNVFKKDSSQNGVPDGMHR